MGDGFQHQSPLHPVAQLVEGLKAELGHPLQGNLLHGQKPRARQVFAQEHTEHRGRVRVLPGDLGELGPGVVGVGGQQQAHVPMAGGAHRQQDLVPAGLIDFVYLGPDQGGIEFRNNAGQAKCVQWHG